MLTVQSKDDSHNTCFKFIGADTTPKTTHLISNNTSLIPFFLKYMVTITELEHIM